VIRKLSLAAAFGAGYVLGAKAGTQRYQQIAGTFRDLAGMPAVQDVTHTLADTANQLGDKAKATVNEKVAAVSDKVTGNDNDVVDLSAGTTTSKSRPAARTAARPRPDAAPSKPEA
jgi:hypothetical protein